jgi:hypothetical protein
MGELAGLGNGDVLIELTVTASGDATCTNPAGATQPPGQNPAPISVSGVHPIPEEELKNGKRPSTSLPRTGDTDSRSAGLPQPQVDGRHQ